MDSRGQRYILDKHGDVRHAASSQYSDNFRYRSYKGQKGVRAAVFNMPGEVDPRDYLYVHKRKFTKEKFKEMMTLLRNTFKYSKSDWCGILGWMVQAAYTAISDHRAQIYFSGSSGHGKSFLMSNVIMPLLDGLTTKTSQATKHTPVSYTHLTLPTIYSV